MFKNDFFIQIKIKHESSFHYISTYEQRLYSGNIDLWLVNTVTEVRKIGYYGHICGTYRKKRVNTNEFQELVPRKWLKLKHKILFKDKLSVATSVTVLKIP